MSTIHNIEYGIQDISSVSYVYNSNKDFKSFMDLLNVT